MYAVRRETSPCFGSSTKVVITNLPEGKSESGPRSTSWNFAPSKEEATSRPSEGTVTTPPITAPRPRVAPSRNLLRGKRSEKVDSMSTGEDAPADGAASGGGGGSARDIPLKRSRTQRKPKKTAIAPPTATAGQLTIRPTSRQATPTANPTGYRVGAGRCDRSTPGRDSNFVTP